MMKRAGFVACGMCMLAATVGAQRGGPVGIAAGLQNQYNGLKSNLTQAADVVPESGWGQKVGTMGEVRTYGQVIGHVAAAQFGQCSTAAGVENPSQGINLEDPAKTRAEIAKALADSFALCDKAFAAVTDQNAGEMISNGRGGMTARAVALMGVIAHGNEMYGISTVYQRAQNIVPPSTAARGRGRGAPAK